MLIYNENKGRLGNSLFRLFANIVFCINYDINSEILSERTHNINYNLIVSDNYFIDFMNKIINNTPLSLIKIDVNSKILFNGYYQHDAIFLKYKKEIINYIERHPELVIKTDRNNSYKAIDFINYKINKKYNIVIHLRLEDFIEISQVIDPNSIKNVIDKINKEYNYQTICIVVNKPTKELEIKYINFFTEKYTNIIIESNDVITDYTIMRESSVLVCSCSTLSWSAAILSNSLQKVYMPNYKNVHGSHQTCKYPHNNTELYEINTCNINDLKTILKL
jgi:hypothetical protein